MTDNFKGFNMDELREVAEVLKIINPARCPIVGSTMAHIRDLVVANIRDGEATYISTLGFVASGYWYNGDDWRYKVSVSAWSMLDHFKKQFKEP